ncbi:MAG: hypothetical protein AVDCRST_MAG23-681 [uncultured Sphingosinicella sp.]|uniref:Uncharacterized protein n=1 Tax=uncultured Sphingosinicella sp. TaxID=478748 RepID=A0A6J4TP50_9SPHN|nr:MAG: hypothetical protein AVDCRST_MAG23-681 [uncultured Sphingosinicella sp.]
MGAELYELSDGLSAPAARVGMPLPHTDSSTKALTHFGPTRLAGGGSRS